MAVRGRGRGNRGEGHGGHGAPGGAQWTRRNKRDAVPWIPRGHQVLRVRPGCGGAGRGDPTTDAPRHAQPHFIFIRFARTLKANHSAINRHRLVLVKETQRCAAAVVWIVMCL